MKKNIHCLILFCILLSCTEDEAPPRPYPRVRTKEVTEITAQGALFQGEVTVSGSLLDHGFIWSTNKILDVGSSEIISLGGRTGAGNFEAQVDRSLAPEVKYYMKAYAKTDEFTVYGEIQEFISLGSKAPIVNAVNREEGTWGDTVIVTGQNFSRIASAMVVKFDTHIAKILRTTPDTVVCIVPQALAHAPSDVSVSFLGNIGKKESIYRLNKPIIELVDPSTASFSSAITITGNFFSTEHSKVYFNGIQSVVTSALKNKLVCIVPEGLPDGSIALSVSTGEGELTTENNFTFLGPHVTSITPLLGTYGDEITITGENFPTSPGILAVKLGNVSCSISTITVNTITITVPHTLPVADNPVSLQFGSSIVTFPQNFVLRPPEILSGVPPKLIYNEYITLAVNHFSCAQGQVFVGGVNADIISCSEGEVVVVPPYSASSHDLEVKIISSGQSTIAVNTIKNAWSHLAAFPSSNAPLKLFNVDGEVFVPAIDYTNGDQNLFRYDANGNYWEKRSEIPVSDITFTTFFALKTGLYAYTYFNGIEFWHYEPDTDQWSRKADPPFQVTEPAMFGIGERGYAVGGTTIDLDYTKEVWEYDPNFDLWTRKNDFPFDNIITSTFQHGNTNYALTNANELLKYDPVSDTWTAALFLDWYQRLLFVIDNKAYCYNSYDGQTSQPYMSRYDMTTDTWEEAELFRSDWSPGIAGLNLNGKGIVIHSNQPSAGVTEFDPDGW